MQNTEFWLFDFWPKRGGGVIKLRRANSRGCDLTCLGLSFDLLNPRDTSDTTMLLAMFQAKVLGKYSILPGNSRNIALLKITKNSYLPPLFAPHSCNIIAL